MKKVFAGIIFMLLVISVSLNVFAEVMILAPFEIPAITDESHETVALAKLGILRGTEKGFELEREVTRAEAVTFILRMHPSEAEIEKFNAPFNDMEGHWAYEQVNTAKEMGLVHGISETEFAPERTITAKEFAKMLLSLCGYSDITVENVYEKAKEHELILNNFTGSIIYINNSLTRGEAVRLCYALFCTEAASGELFYRELINSSKFTQEEMHGVILSGSVSSNPETFSDKINKQMPDDKNYMFSPLSVKTALAVAANGAEGETLTQITHALQLDDLDAFNRYAKKLIEDYSKSDILKLNIANSVWINESVTSQKFSEEFNTVSDEFYGASGFYEKSDVIVPKINSWVSEKTNGKISKIVTDSDFYAMLVNAVYFNGRWQNEFSEAATKKDAFTDINGKESEIEFMNDTGYYNYYAESNQILELPYLTRSYNEQTEEFERLDTDVSMYLISGDYSEMLLKSAIESNDMKSKYIKLSIPKFRIEYADRLDKILNEMGITKAFEADAEFSKMFDKGSMFITDVIHKTYIDVDEKGTEAAAVTGVGMGGSAMPPEPVEVKFNTPFTFVIYDKTNSEILFMGKYAFAE